MCLRFSFKRSQYFYFKMFINTNQKANQFFFFLLQKRLLQTTTLQNKIHGSYLQQQKIRHSLSPADIVAGRRSCRTCFKENKDCFVVQIYMLVYNERSMQL